MNLTNAHEKFLRPDSKGRISLGKLAEGVSSYKVKFNKSTHQVILEPYTELPLQEKWLYENKEALKRIRRGLRESSRRKLKDSGSFAKYIDE